MFVPNLIIFRPTDLGNQCIAQVVGGTLVLCVGAWSASLDHGAAVQLLLQLSVLPESSLCGSNRQWIQTVANRWVLTILRMLSGQDPHRLLTSIEINRN